ncbi:unnamed protein product [Gordionus sp. m RMFG-2023]
MDAETGDLPLDLALNSGQEILAQTLIKYKADLNAYDKFGIPLLHKAMMRSDEKSCNFLLDNGADPNLKDRKLRRNALHLLADVEKYKRAKHICSQNDQSKAGTQDLIDFGSCEDFGNNLSKINETLNCLDIGQNDVHDKQSNKGNKISAIEQPSIDVVPNHVKFNMLRFLNKLLELGADVNAVDFEKKTPLQLAIENGCQTIFDVLLQNPNLELVNTRDKSGHSIIYAALNCPLKNNETNHYFEMASRLIAKGVPHQDVINTVNGLPLLNELMMEGNLKASEFLIKLEGVNLNCCDNQGTRPIHILAAFENCLNLAQILLDSTSHTSLSLTDKMDSLDINATTLNKGQSALHVSLIEKNFAFLNLVLDKYCSNNHGVHPKLFSRYLDLNIIDYDDQTPLSLALKSQNYEIATKLIFNGSDINLVHPGGKTLLEICITENDENGAIFLLENGANLHSANQLDLVSSNTSHLFELSIKRGLIGVVKALCQLGVDVNCLLSYNNAHDLNDATILNDHQNQNGFINHPESDKKGDMICPLWLSLILNKYDIACVLVQYGCDTTYWCEGPEGCLQTLLHKAIDMNEEDIACFLVRSNCEVNCVRKPGPSGQGGEEATDKQTPLHLSCAWGLDKLVACLLEHKADINIIDSESKTPLHVAIENQHQALIHSLLSHPFINLTIKDKRGKTAFESALDLKNHEAALAIVNREPGASEQMDSKGFNFLHNSIKNKDIENVLFLIGIRANVNSRVQDFLQNTPLHLATSESSEIIIRNLILAGSDVNAKNTNSQTPLHLAVISGNADYVRIMVENGADIDAKDNNGNSVLHLAIMNGNIECLEYLLIETDISPDTINFKNRSALHLIGIYVKDNGSAVFDLFKQHRQNFPINAQDNDGNTPLLYAYLNGRGNLCRSLVKGGASLGNTNFEGVSIFNAQVASHQLLFRLLDMLNDEPTWTESDYCNECNTKFGITMRKHHCRHCGRILCTKCSDKTMPISKYNLTKPVRVCSVCYDVLTSKINSK